MENRKIRVLIVEADRAAAEAVEEVVRQLGYAVVGRAAGAEAALQMAAELRPDVILMDLGLAGPDGAEIARRIQQQNPTPVVAFSAHNGKELSAKAAAAGAGAFVAYPPGAAELERAVAIARARFKDMMELDRLNKKLQAETAERRRAEEELRREHGFVEGLIDTAQAIVLVLDAQGRIVRFNRYLQDISGWALREVQDKDWFETFLPEDERERIRTLFEQAVAGGPLEGRVVNRIVDRAGRDHTVEWFSKKLVDADGTLLGVLATGQDITERERTEQERQRLQDQLLQAQKMESIGRLAGGIAHDFNNLLTPMIGYAEMAMMDLHQDDPLYKDLQEIREAAERAKNLTGQLLAFSRRQMLETKVVNLNDIVASFEKMLQRIIGEDVQIITSLAPDLASVKADPDQIQQVLMNLAVNARDAMPAGGKLEIKTENATLDSVYGAGHAGVTPGNYVMLAVSDTGIGMSRETANQIFEPFFTTKAPGKGTGLGLATVYGIVKQHGGHIWVYSEPGRGTTFRTYLPQATGERAPNRAPEPEPHYTPAQGTVLVVEDEDAVRKLACNILKNNGYKILEASTSKQALKIAKEHPGNIDLLLTDVVMPQMNGRELYRKIAEARPGIKVLYMSGYTDEIIAHQGVLEEQIEFLQKPFTLELLLKKISRMLAAPQD